LSIPRAYKPPAPSQPPRNAEPRRLREQHSGRYRPFGIHTHPTDRVYYLNGRSRGLTKPCPPKRGSSKQLDAALDALEQERTDAETARVAADAERATAAEAQAAELTALVTTEKQRLDTLVPNFETQFTDAKEARQAKFDALFDMLG